MTDPLNLEELELDWTLASKRLAKDVRDDFWPDPLELVDVLTRREATIERLRPSLKAFRPETNAPLYHIPKANFTLRDSIQLSPTDRLVYQALVDPLAAHIDQHLTEAVFSHRLRGPAHKWMFKSGVEQWKAFRQAVATAAMASPGSFLVVTDLSQYFENVSFRHLKRHLESLTTGTNLKRVVDTLHVCLKSWSPYKDCGLPQNIDASSFLGNALLDIVDRHMLREDHKYFRYMDDIQIVVATEAEARVALMRLIGHLREIGLGVNSAKTKRLRPDTSEMEAFLCDTDPDLDAIEKAVRSMDRATVQKAVPTVYQKARMLIESNDTSERAFRFCINRITSFRLYGNLDLPDDGDITLAVLSLLPTRPAESDTFCRYLSTAPLQDVHKKHLVRLLCDEPLCVYRWQNYLLWRLATQRKLVEEALQRRARQVLQDAKDSPELAGAALYLGACGDYADRQAVLKGSRIPCTPFVRRCFTVALQELHAADRAPAYRELAERDDEGHLLTAHLASLAAPIYVPAPPAVGLEDLPDHMPSVY